MGHSSYFKRRTGRAQPRVIVAEGPPSSVRIASFKDRHLTTGGIAFPSTAAASAGPQAVMTANAICSLARLLSYNNIEVQEQAANVLQNTAIHGPAWAAAVDGNPILSLVRLVVAWPVGSSPPSMTFPCGCKLHTAIIIELHCTQECHFSRDFLHINGKKKN